MLLKTILILFFFILFPLQGQDWNSELMIQSALYEEKSLGNLPKAIEIYHNILSKQDIAQEMRAKVHLRLAMCYEKSGNIMQAQGIYENMLKDYSDFTEIIRAVSSRLREILRRKEISNLKEKLLKLQESDEKIRLEEEIKKLQERIRSLVKTAPEPENKEIIKNQEENKKDSLKVEERISDALSSHLYKISKNLYQQGLLWSTRENLKKSLEFNPKNQESQELLQKVEILIQEQEKKLKEEKGYSKESIELSIVNDIKKNEDSSPESAIIIKPEFPEEKSEEASLVEKRYDVNILFQQWKIKEEDLPEEALWSNSLLKFLKENMDVEWKKNTYVNYQNKGFAINQTIANHKKLESLWQQLGENSHLILMKGMLFFKEKEFFLEDKITFIPATGGIYYSFLPGEIKEKWQPSLSPIHSSQEIFLFSNQKQEWKYFLSTPLVQGYQAKNLVCKIYKEGVHFILQDLAQEKKMFLQILSKKIQRPIPLVNSNIGPMHIPCFLSQQGEIEIVLEQEKHLIVGGIMDFYEPGIKKNTGSSLYALFTFQKIPILSFLGREIKSEKKSEDESTQNYDVDFLQKINDIKWNLKDQDILSKEDRDSFILEYFKEEQGDSPKQGNAHIFKNFLIVTAPSAIHQKIKDKLDQLRIKQRMLLGMDLYLVSCEKQTLRKILDSWKIPVKQTEGLQWYAIELPFSEVLKKYKEFSDIKILYTFNSIIIGNTQKVSLKNCQIVSYIDNLKYQEDNPLQISMLDVHEGIRIDIRPLIASEKEGMLQLQTSLSKIKGERKIPFSISSGQKAFLSIPEINIIRFQINIPIKRGECYIVSGFQEIESEKTKDVFFFFAPDIINFVPPEKNTNQ